MEIAAHAIAREPPCYPCTSLEISQVSNLQDKHNASFFSKYVLERVTLILLQGYEYLIFDDLNTNKLCL